MTIIGETEKGRQVLRTHYSDTIDNGLGLRRALEHLEDIEKFLKEQGLEVTVR